MSPGKLAAQVSHASMAFIVDRIRNSEKSVIKEQDSDEKFYSFNVKVRSDIYDDWMCGAFTKTICEAKNRGQLMKAAEKAKELGLKENEDYYLIKDNCLTELEPEEFDEDGNGHTLTCIGFRPFPDETAHEISRKYHLYM